MGIRFSDLHNFMTKNYLDPILAAEKEEAEKRFAGDKQSLPTFIYENLAGGMGGAAETLSSTLMRDGLGNETDEDVAPEDIENEEYHNLGRNSLRGLLGDINAWGKRTKEAHQHEYTPGSAYYWGSGLLQSLPESAADMGAGALVGAVANSALGPELAGLGAVLGAGAKIGKYGKRIQQAYNAYQGASKAAKFARALTPSARTALGGLAQTGVEAEFEKTHAIDDYIEKAKQNGTYVPGQTEEEAQQIGENVFRDNMMLLPATNMLEQGLTFGKGSLKALKAAGINNPAVRKWLARGVNFLGNADIEGVEETGQDFAQMYEAGEEIDPEKLAESYVSGVLMGGLLNAAGRGSQRLFRPNRRNGNIPSATDDNAESMNAEGEPSLSAESTENGEAIPPTVPGSASVDDGLSAGFAEFEGQRMPSGENGCVEGVVRLGQTYSPFLQKELENGTARVGVLVDHAKEDGVPVVPFNEAALQKGDVIVYFQPEDSTDNTDNGEHVVIYDGNGGYVGNSSSQERIVQGGDYTEMSGLVPKLIIKTGGQSTGNAVSPAPSVSPIDYQSTPASDLNDWAWDKYNGMANDVASGKMSPEEAIEKGFDFFSGIVGEYDQTGKLSGETRQQIADEWGDDFAEHISSKKPASETEAQAPAQNTPRTFQTGPSQSQTPIQRKAIKTPNLEMLRAAQRYGFAGGMNQDLTKQQPVSSRLFPTGPNDANNKSAQRQAQAVNNAVQVGQYNADLTRNTVNDIVQQIAQQEAARQQAQAAQSQNLPALLPMLPPGRSQQQAQSAIQTPTGGQIAATTADAIAGQQQAAPVSFLRQPQPAGLQQLIQQIMERGNQNAQNQIGSAAPAPEVYQAGNDQNSNVEPQTGTAAGIADNQEKVKSAAQGEAQQTNGETRGETIAPKEKSAQNGSNEAREENAENVASKATNEREKSAQNQDRVSTDEFEAQRERAIYQQAMRDISDDAQTRKAQGAALIELARIHNIPLEAKLENGLRHGYKKAIKEAQSLIRSAIMRQREDRIFKRAEDGIKRQIEQLKSGEIDAAEAKRNAQAYIDQFQADSGWVINGNLLNKLEDLAEPVGIKNRFGFGKNKKQEQKEAEPKEQKTENAKAAVPLELLDDFDDLLKTLHKEKYNNDWILVLDLLEDYAKNGASQEWIDALEKKGVKATWQHVTKAAFTSSERITDPKKFVVDEATKYLQAAEKAETTEAPAAENRPQEQAESHFTIGDHVHTKTGEKIPMAKPKDRVDEVTFKRMREYAKENGGYYNRYAKAFFFKDFAEGRDTFVREIDELLNEQKATREKSTPETETAADNATAAIIRELKGRLDNAVQKFEQAKDKNTQFVETEQELANIAEEAYKAIGRGHSVGALNDLGNAADSKRYEFADIVTGASKRQEKSAAQENPQEQIAPAQESAQEQSVTLTNSNEKFMEDKSVTDSPNVQPYKERAEGVIEAWQAGELRRSEARDFLKEIMSGANRDRYEKGLTRDEMLAAQGFADDALRIINNDDVNRYKKNKDQKQESAPEAANTTTEKKEAESNVEASEKNETEQPAGGDVAGRGRAEGGSTAGGHQGVSSGQVRGTDADERAGESENAGGVLQGQQGVSEQHGGSDNEAENGGRRDNAGERGGRESLRGNDSEGNGAGAVQPNLPVKKEKAEAVVKEEPAADGDKPAETPGHNFRFKAESGEGVGVKTKFKNNVAAVRLLKQLEAEDRRATPEEQAILAKWNGWGTVKDAFTDKPDWAKENKELRELLTKEEYDAAAKASLNAFYTTPEVINAMWQGLKRLGFVGGRVLDPSMGSGRFFGFMPKEMEGKSSLYGVEKDSLTGRLAAQLFQKADVQVKGYEETTLPNNFFDVAISNVPFGDTKLYDPNYEKTSTGQNVKYNIHNYFFAKSMDKVRPGGFVVFITGPGTMQTQSGEAAILRSELGRKADLVAAYKLPGSAFAKDAGTEVTTDILILQKREDPKKPAKYAKKWDTISTVEVPVKDAGYDLYLPLNDYYQKHPDHMLGTPMADKLYRGGDNSSRFALDGQGRDVGKELSALMKKLPKDIYAPVKGKQQSTVESSKTFLAEPGTVDQTFLVKDGKAYQNRQGVNTPVAESQQGLVKDYVDLRGYLNALLKAQIDPAASDAMLKSLRDALNKSYDSFVKKHGYLNAQEKKGPKGKKQRGAAAVLMADPLYGQVASIEKYSKDKSTGKENVEKADIFTKRTVGAIQDVESATSPTDALAVSISMRGRLDIPYMANLLSMKEDDLTEALGDMIYKNPALDNWELAEEYLSGNVREKLVQAETAAKTNPKYKRNVDALKKVQPVDYTEADIKANLGAPWIPTEVYNDFCKHMVGGGLEVSHNDIINSWGVEPTKYGRPDYVAMEQTWGAGGLSFDELLKKILGKTEIKATYKDADGNTRVDAEKTAAAVAKAEEIQKEFEKWLWESSYKEPLLKSYNKLFNSEVERQYDGSALTFPGLASEVAKKLYPHQKNAIWRMMQGKNTLIAHCVGAGKTWEMQIAGMEMKRVGICRKPMYIVPNNIVYQFQDDFYKVYPNAKLLVLTSKELPGAKLNYGADDFTEKLDTKEHKTKNEKSVTPKKAPKAKETDAKKQERLGKRRAGLSRIATEDWDGVIISHDLFSKMPMSPEYYQDFYREQVEELDAAIRQMKENKMNKRDISNLEKAKANLEARLKRDIKEDKKEVVIPFEELGVDQIFVDEADKFKNLAFHTSMTRLSGISQSNAQRSTDMLVKTRYLSEMHNGRGVVFATGTPISNTMNEMFTMQRYLDRNTLRDLGMRHFDSWASMFGIQKEEAEPDASGNGFTLKTKLKFTNLKVLGQMFRRFADIKQPEDLPYLKRPKLNGGQRTVITVEPSPAFDRYKETLIERADAIHSHAVDPSEDNMLKLTNDFRNASMDMRLVDPSVPASEADAKIQALCDTVFREYQEANATNGAQVIFSDIGTPKAEKNVDADVEESFDGTPDKFTSTVYSEIKKELVKRGIPSEEIAFVHDAKNLAQRQELFEKVNEGKIRVFLGSTEMMGAGTNMQKHLACLHHLDCPWKPRDVEQREGRILRAGNENEEVKIFTYVTKGSYDANMWDKVRYKQRMIDSVMRGDPAVDEMDDVNSESSASYGEIAALGMDNPLMAEKVKVDAEVMRLSALASNYRVEQTKMKRDIARLPQRIDYAKQEASRAEKDIKARKPTKGDAFRMTLGNKTFDTRKDAQAKLESIDKVFKDNASTKIGEIGGFEIHMRHEAGYVENKGNGVVQHGRNVIQLVNNGSYTADTSVSSIEYAVNNAPDRTLAQAEFSQRQAEKELRGLEEEIKKPFAQQEALDAALKRQKEIQQELDKTNDKAPAEVSADNVNVDEETGEIIENEGGESAPKMQGEEAESNKEETNHYEIGTDALDRPYAKLKNGLSYYSRASDLPKYEDYNAAMSMPDGSTIFWNEEDRDAYVKAANAALNGETGNNGDRESAPVSQEEEATPRISFSVDARIPHQSGSGTTSGEMTEAERMRSEARELSRDEWTPKQKKIADFGEQMGVPVVFIDGDPRLHGYHENGVTYLNVNSEIPIQNVFWHESFHWMRNNNPELYSDLIGRMQELDIFSEEDIESYRESIGRPELTNEEAVEEMLADAMMDKKQREDIMQNVAKSDKNLIERFVAWLRETMKSFQAFMKNPDAGLTRAKIAAMNNELAKFLRRVEDGNGNRIFSVTPKGEIRKFSGSPLPAVAYSFAGEKSKTADTKKLYKALAMSASGRSAQEIYQKTGWIHGKDGKWRYEIPDLLSKIDFSNVIKRGVSTLEKVYDNPKLYEAYPFLKKIRVEAAEMDEDTYGQALKRTIQINKDMLDNEESKKTLVHEIQHMIQGREGFGIGGDPEDVREVLGNKTEYSSISDDDLYRRLAGEQESREVERRAENQQTYERAKKELADAEKALAEAKRNGSAAEVKAAKERLEKAKFKEGMARRQAEKMPTPHGEDAIIIFDGQEIAYSVSKKAPPKVSYSYRAKKQSSAKNQSFLTTLRNKLASVVGDGTMRIRKEMKDALERAAGVAIRAGHIDSITNVKTEGGVIRTRNAYDWETILPEAGKAIAKRLGLDPSDKMGDYIGRWILDGALNDTSQEAADFQKAMRKHPELQDQILDAHDIFQEWNNMDADKRIEASVQWTPRGTLERLLLGDTTIKDELAAAQKVWYDEWIEELGSLGRMEKNIEKKTGKKISGQDSALRAFRLLRGATGKFMTMIEGKDAQAVEAIKSLFPNVDFEGFKTLRMILDDAGVRQDKEGMRQFMTYCIAKHSMSIHKRNEDLELEQLNLERKLKQAKTEEEKATLREQIVDIGRQIMQTPNTRKDAEATIAKFAKRFGKAQQDLVRFSRVTMDIMVDSGLVSEARRDEMAKAWPDYVPFFRVFDENEDVQFGDSLKHVSGSKRDLVNPLESIIKNTFEFVRRAEKNKAKLKIANLAKMSDVGEYIQLVDAAKPEDKTVLDYYEDGKKKFIQTDPTIVTAIRNMGLQSSTMFGRILRFPAQIARAAFTMANPSFALRNVLRDGADAYLYSKYGYNPLKDFARGLMHAIKQDEMYYEWMASGAAQASMISLDRDYTQSAINNITRTWQERLVHNPLDLLQIAGEYSEYATRIGAYERAKNEILKRDATISAMGAITEAAFESRDLMDFSRGGKSSRAMDQLIIFSNASIQGWDKFFRTFDFRKDKKAAMAALARLAISAILPSIALFMLNHDKDWWKEIPDWQKEKHWIIKVGDTILRIPKGQDPGIQFFSNLVEKGMVEMVNKDPVKWTKYIRPLWNTMPEWLPTTFMPFIEVGANYSFFTERNIVPQYQKKLPEKMQYGPHTSSFAKWLGEKIGVAPSHIDHIIAGYGGNLARGVFNVYDQFAGNQPLNTSKEEMPIISGLTIMPYKNPKSVQEYYEKLDEQEKLYNEYKMTGVRPDGFDPALYGRMKKVRTSLQKLSKMERALMNNPNVSLNERKERQEKIQARRVEIIKRVMGR